MEHIPHKYFLSFWKLNLRLISHLPCCEETFSFMSFHLSVAQLSPEYLGPVQVFVCACSLKCFPYFFL